MTLIISGVAITGIVFVNSRYDGSFFVGLLLIVLPLLGLSYSLPYVIPVHCPRCGGRMRFRFITKANEARQLYAYICDQCRHRHEWEGATSGSTLD